MLSKPWTALLALIVILPAAALVARAGEGLWISAHGEHTRLEGDTVFVGDDGGQTFDLSELADGETRVFGAGERQVSVTRVGDEARIERAARGDEGPLSVRCDLTRDACSVITFADDPERVTIVIRKTRECENGAGDCDVSITDLTSGSGAGQARVLVRSAVDCDDEGECHEVESLTSAGPHGAHLMRFGPAATSGQLVVIDGSGGSTVFFGDDSRVTLRCPEGDTTMRVAADEADDVFLCPKHSLPLERQQAPANRFEFRTETAAEPDVE